MSSEKLRTQIQFENILSGNDSAKWYALRDSEIKSFEFNASHNVLFESALKADATDFYYKGVISLYEGLCSVEAKNFSWATVKIYYSIFYLLRSSLCSNGIAFVRKDRECYQFLNRLSEKPKKVSALHKSDHKAAIELFREYHSRTDFLQSNTIEGKNSYQWLMEKREDINYKYRTFFEPDKPPFWEYISTCCDSDGLEYWIGKYEMENVYAFLEDHAMIALPIRRLILTHTDLTRTGIVNVIHPDKQDKLVRLLRKHKFLAPLRKYNRGRI